jgi:hypothetical protein
VGNVGRVDDAGETSLAAATAAIITARWTAASHKAAPPTTPAGSGPGAADSYGFDDGRTNGHSGSSSVPNGSAPNAYANDSAANGYAADGQSANGHSGNGHSGNGHPTNGYEANGYEANGHEANGHEANGYAPDAYAADAYPPDPHPVDAYSPSAYPADAYAPDPHPSDSYAAGSQRPDAYGAEPYDPYVADPYGVAEHAAWAPPVEAGGPSPTDFAAPAGGESAANSPGQLTDAQVRHDSVAFGSAAASFFAATHMDVVPEVFPVPRIPGQRGGPDDSSPGSVIPDPRFPETFAPDQYAGDGFSAFGSATPAAAAPPLPPAPLAPDEVTGTRVPPGFERRTFGPFPDEPAPGYGGAAMMPATTPATTSAPVPGSAPADGFAPVEPPAFPDMGEFGAFDKPAYGQGVTQFSGSEFAPPVPVPSLPPQSFASGPAYPAYAAPVPTDAPLSFPPSDFAPQFEAPPFEAPPFEPPPFATSFEPQSFEPQSFASPPFAPPSFNPAEFAPPTFDPAEFAPPSFDFGSTRDLGPGPESELPRREAQREAPVALLPRRTPQIPDVPEYAAFANDPLLDPSTQPADGTDLTRIATYLSSLELLTEYKPDGFDFADVLEAVKGVRHVRDAHLRWNSGAGHTLRIEFTDDADEAEVTRVVVRLLREKMGLAAGPSVEEPTLDRPLPRPRSSVQASASVPARPAVGGSAPAVRLTRDNPLPRSSSVDTARSRVVVDHVQVTTLGTDATVEVRLLLSRAGKTVGAAVGTGQGPAVDAYLLRLAATSAGTAVDELLADGGESRGRCFVEHVTVVPFGVVEVAIVVLLLTYDGHTEQLAGSAIVSGDPRQAVVRATLAALNRRLESLLS